MIKVLGTKVLLERISVEEKTLSGIILEKTIEKTARGKVVALGKGVTDIELGNEVLFENFRGIPLEVEGNNYILLEEEFIIGVFE